MHVKLANNATICRMPLFREYGYDIAELGEGTQLPFLGLSFVARATSRADTLSRTAIRRTDVCLPERN